MQPSGGPVPSRPLDGLRVLDLSRLLPGPYCTLILSDLGARVDKLEDPQQGDYLRTLPPTPGGFSGRFIAINRDKRSLCLDLKRPEGRAALLRLVAGYDVLVESFRPGVLDRLGCGYDALAARNPALVLCSISGYGQTGPYRDRAGHDLNYVALAGVLGANGAPGGPPQALGVQLADVAGGSLWAAVGILAALHQARATGRGRIVDVSMCEGALAFLLPDLGMQAQSGEIPHRGEGLLRGDHACYGVYRTSDGRYLSVAALEPKFWAALQAALGRPCDYSELVAPPEVQARVRRELAGIFVSRTRDEWEAIFRDVDACVEPVLTTEELLSHPQHVARGLGFDVGGYSQVRTPLAPRDAGGGRTPPLPPPALGQHSTEILRDAGFQDAEIAALAASGTLGPRGNGGPTR